MNRERGGGGEGLMNRERGGRERVRGRGAGEQGEGQGERGGRERGGRERGGGFGKPRRTAITVSRVSL